MCVKSMWLVLIHFVLMTFLSGPMANAQPDESSSRVTVSAMAPLYIGNPEQPNNPRTKKLWKQFEQDLKKAKELGVTSISVDVWWGIVQKDGPDSFDWSYYDRIFKSIVDSGLKWIPILSTHSCGGNVGDDVNIPLPNWIWNINSDLKFISEGGNSSNESVSVWKTKEILPIYEKFFQRFSEHFSAKAENISEIELSLGPSGELRYPSYNSHDASLPFARYPFRGAMQASSPSAISDFQTYALNKYGSIEAVNRAWYTGYQLPHEILPPVTSSQVNSLFDRLNQRLSAQETLPRIGYNPVISRNYDKDVLNWYQASLLEHGKTLLTAASEVFGTSAFKNTSLGIKIPGVHWRIDNRSAEMTAGLVNADGASRSVNEGMGYDAIFKMLANVREQRPDLKLVVYYTAGATLTYQEQKNAASDAGALVLGFEQAAQLAKAQGIELGLENALEGNLESNENMQLLGLFMQHTEVNHLTLLRLDSVVSKRAVRRLVNQLTQEPVVPTVTQSSLQAVRMPGKGSPYLAKADLDGIAAYLLSHHDDLKRLTEQGLVLRLPKSQEQQGREIKKQLSADLISRGIYQVNSFGKIQSIPIQLNFIETKLWNSILAEAADEAVSEVSAEANNVALENVSDEKVDHALPVAQKYKALAKHQFKQILRAGRNVLYGWVGSPLAEVKTWAVTMKTALEMPTGADIGLGALSKAPAATVALHRIWTTMPQHPIIAIATSAVTFTIETYYGIFCGTYNRFKDALVANKGLDYTMNWEWGFAKIQGVALRTLTYFGTDEQTAPSHVMAEFFLYNLAYDIIGGAFGVRGWQGITRLAEKGVYSFKTRNAIMQIKDLMLAMNLIMLNMGHPSTSIYFFGAERAIDILMHVISETTAARPTWVMGNAAEMSDEQLKSKYANYDVTLLNASTFDAHAGRNNIPLSWRVFIWGENAKVALNEMLSALPASAANHVVIKPLVKAVARVKAACQDALVRPYLTE